jgi:hypothetical protein
LKRSQEVDKLDIDEQEMPRHANELVLFQVMKSWLFFLGVVISACTPKVSGLTIEVAGGTQQCFYEHLVKHRNVHVEVFTLQSESGSLTIQLQVHFRAPSQFFP